MHAPSKSYKHNPSQLSVLEKNLQVPESQMGGLDAELGQKYPDNKLQNATLEYFSDVLPQIKLFPGTIHISENDLDGFRLCVQFEVTEGPE